MNKYPTIKTIVKSLSNKIDIDKLTDIIIDQEDYNNTLIDLAKQCKEQKENLSEEEKSLYELNPELIIKYVAREVGLMI